MENSKFCFNRGAVIVDKEVCDVRIVIGRVFDYDAEEFYYMLEDQTTFAISKWTVEFVEKHFYLKKI